MSSPATTKLRLGDFDFALPPELIAQHPASERSGSRLLDGRPLDGHPLDADLPEGHPPCGQHPEGRSPGASQPIDRRFRDLPGLLAPRDLLVFNDTRVIKARLHGVKATGGSVEALVERVLPGHEVLAHLRASKSPRPGGRVRFAEAFDAEVLGRAGPEESLFRLRFPDDPFKLLERHGRVPLPPYIAHADGLDDEHRYQTVFATQPGAVAAPTAALHFDAAVLDDLAQRSIATARITLHVGAGTFQPVRTDDLSQHRMHSEWFDVPEATVQAIERTRAAGGRIVAIGTTTLRALESAALSGTLHPSRHDTDIFIIPGFTFRVVDLLLTNFHLPKSTLMVLVSAFAGHAHIRSLYDHAIRERYRFFSYGDAMLLERSKGVA